MALRLTLLLFVITLGTTRAQPVFQLAPPLIRYPSVFFEKEQTVTIAFAHPGALIYYTLDGRMPTEKDSLYRQPITLREGQVILQARCYAPGFLPSEVAKVHFMKQGWSIRSVSGSEPHPRYPGSGPETLFDNRGGIPNTGSSTWQGYDSDLIELNVVLRDTEDVSRVLLHFFENQGSWIFLPEQVIVRIYDNAKKAYVPFGQQCLSAAQPAQQQQACVPIVVTGSANTSVLHILIKAVRKIPEWHPASGQHAWVFLDEIKIY